MRKLVTISLLVAVVGVGSFAQMPINLSDLNTDFDTLMTGVTRDVSPLLQMSALAGEPVGDASIDGFMVFLPGLGVSLTDGLGKVLQQSGSTWKFPLAIPSIINSAIGTDPAVSSMAKAFETKFFPFPTAKIGFGIGLPGGFDVIASGMYWSQAWTDSIINLAESSPTGTIHSLKPQLTFANIGLKVRKTLLKDEGMVPALSLGLGYTYSDFNLGASISSLASVTGSPVDVSGLGTLDLKGALGMHTTAHNIGLELHLSKHLLFFTPFVKLAAVYQYSLAAGNLDMLATLTPNATIPGATASTQSIKSTPTMTISDFSALATVGFDLNLFIFILDANMAFDLGRAYFNVSDLSLTGVAGKGTSLNVGLRWQF